MPLCPGCPRQRPPYPEVTEANCRVPSASFSQAPWYTLPVLTRRLFPGTPSPPEQSDKLERFTASVTIRWPGNVRPVPIDYAFRPRLRGRLTLRRLTLRRNPWTFGESVFHTLCRYSCQHSHFPYLQKPSRVFLRRPRERSATACSIRRRTHPKLRLVA